jgi:tRNA-2-methylthio-N6-dimethylallyladenosine synthase
MKRNSGLWDKVLKKLPFGQNVDSYLWYGGGLKKDFAS